MEIAGRYDILNYLGLCMYRTYRKQGDSEKVYIFTWILFKNARFPQEIVRFSLHHLEIVDGKIMNWHQKDNLLLSTYL